MKYLVTGATGFIGGRLARQLRSEGHEVRALVRDPKGPHAQGLVGVGVQIFPGDVTDRSSVKAPMEGVDGVFHVAGYYKLGAKDRDRAYPVNVEGTRNVLETMRDLKVPKGVYTSTLGVFSDTRGKVVDETYVHQGRFLSRYEETKWKAHYEVALPLMKQGLPLVIVQPGAVYGPGDTSEVHTLIDQYLRGKLRAIPRDAAFCFGHVDDTATGHRQAMERGTPGEAYILSGPPYKVPQVFELAATWTGIPAPKTLVSSGMLRFLGAVTRSERLRSGAATYLGTSAKAERALGWNPRPFEAGLKATLEAERARLGSGAS